MDLEKMKKIYATIANVWCLHVKKRQKIYKGTIDVEVETGLLFHPMNRTNQKRPDNEKRTELWNWIVFMDKYDGFHIYLLFDKMEQQNTFSM